MVEPKSESSDQAKELGELFQTPNKNFDIDEITAEDLQKYLNTTSDLNLEELDKEVHELLEDEVAPSTSAILDATKMYVVILNRFDEKTADSFWENAIGDMDMLDDIKDSLDPNGFLLNELDQIMIFSTTLKFYHKGHHIVCSIAQS